MKKLKLRLDDIRVTGFEVLPSEARGVGTVQGAEMVTIRTRCDGHDTCPLTCQLSCNPADC